MMPPMVRSVCTSGLPQAKRAAEPLAVNTQLPTAAPTGSTATLNLPLAVRSTRRFQCSRPGTRWVQTKEPVTCMISIRNCLHHWRKEPLAHRGRHWGPPVVLQRLDRSWVPNPAWRRFRKSRALYPRRGPSGQ